MKKNVILEYIKSIAGALVLALIIRSFVFQSFTIPTGSMIPNLMIGDYIFASKYKYGYSRYSFPFGVNLFEGRVLHHEPERGDIIIFQSPNDYEDVYYVKRLIGLPHDKIQIRDCNLYINDQKVHRELIPDKKNFPNFDVYHEKLPNGVEYDTLSIADGRSCSHFPNQTPVYEVPEGHYFFLGDNRDNSADSRYINKIGFVPADRIVAKSSVVYWSKTFSRIFTIF